MAHDPTNRKHVEAAEKVSERTQRENDQFVGHIMSTVQGRRWMEGFLETCHVYQTSFNGNALQTAFLEGERHVGLDLMITIMRVCPDQWVQMMRERNIKEVTEDGRRSPSNDDRIPFVGTDGRALVDPST